MRLAGYAFVRPVGPITRGFLPFSDITVLLGANDAGKSRLLAGVAAHLDHTRCDESADGREAATFFLELTEGEREQLLRLLWAELPAELRHQRRKVRLTPVSVEWPNLGFWIRLLSSADDLTPARKERLEQLENSCVFAFSPTDDGSWSVYWCDAAALEPGHQPELEPAEKAHLDLIRLFVDQAAAHEAVAEAPLVTVLLGKTRAPVMPRPLRVPLELDELLDEVAGVVTRLAAHLSWGRVARAADLLEPGGDGEELISAVDELLTEFRRLVPDETERTDLWLEAADNGRTARLRDEVIAICGLVGAVAQSRLPDFVAARYRVVVEARQLPHWSPERPLIVELEALHSGTRFPVQHVAEGFRVWLQLALLESADVVRATEVDLRQRLGGLKLLRDDLAEALEELQEARSHFESVREEVEGADDDDLPSAYSESDLDDATNDLQWAEDRVDSTSGEIDAELTGYADALGAAGSGAAIASDRGRSFAALATIEGAAVEGGETIRDLRPPLYLVDEPERQLHPRLQRRAAAWIASAMRERNSQAVVASHSVPFLNLGDGSQLVYLSGGLTARPLETITPADLQALGLVASDLGLDRGELMAMYEILLFVEGASDQALLEELYGDRLRTAGVLVVPISGVGNHLQIVTAEVLLRLTSAHVATLFDNLAEPEIERLRTDPDYRREQRSKGNTERQALAALIEALETQQRPLTAFGIPVDDIFDLLDTDILQREYPTYPGHEAAHSAWSTAEKRHRNRFLDYQQRYNVPVKSVDLYRRIGRAMRAAARTPSALDVVVDQLEKLAGR